MKGYRTGTARETLVTTSTGLMQIKGHVRTCLSDGTGQHNTPVGPDTASPATPNLQKGGAVFPALMLTLVPIPVMGWAVSGD